MNQTSWTYYRNAGVYAPFPHVPLYRRLNWYLIGVFAGGAGFWLAVIWWITS